MRVVCVVATAGRLTSQNLKFFASALREYAATHPGFVYDEETKQLLYEFEIPEER